MAHETFRVGDLTAVIGDNEAYDGRRPGYNGVHRLTHRTNPNSLFTVTGLNRERCSREEVLKEFRNWRTSLEKERR